MSLFVKVIETKFLSNHEPDVRKKNRLKKMKVAYTLFS